VNSLRHLNLIGIYFVHHAALLCRKYIEAKLILRFHKAPCTTFTSAIHDCVSYFNYHSAINIAAFPVLFFFSGLFYTDVFSAVSVLLAYQLHLFRTLTRPAVWNGALVFLLGIAALFMRQTNVFWVAVYLGGLEAIHAVKSLRPKPVLRNEHKYRNLGQLAKHFLWRYSIGDIHDPPLGVSGPDGRHPPTAPGSFASKRSY
jgi:alpha-1,2-glucosyltransferase